MLNCGVTETLCAGVVAGTWFITLKIATTLHLDHNIGLNKCKLNLLSTIILWNIMFLKKKETIMKLCTMAL